MHERTALETREDGRVDLARDLLVIGEHHAAARTAKRLVRRGGGNVTPLQWVRMDTAGNEPGEMRHIDMEYGADLVRHLAEAREVDLARNGRTPGNDQL